MCDIKYVKFKNILKKKSQEILKCIMSLIIILIKIIIYLLKRTIENRIIVFLKSMNNQLAVNNFKYNNQS